MELNILLTITYSSNTLSYCFC